MRKRHTVSAFLCLVGIVVLLMAGCGSVNRTPTSGKVNKTPTSVRNELNGLRIVLNDLTGESAYATYTIHSAVKAQELYKAVEALPPAPNYIGCSFDYGYRYYVTFLHDNVQVLPELLVWPEGCFYVGFTPKDVRTAYGNKAFWELFAHILGVPESQVHPTPTAIP